ncbi:hypothetical protein LCGC14_2396700, partial [marine sediment metagenome]
RMKEIAKEQRSIHNREMKILEETIEMEKEMYEEIRGEKQ